MRRVDVLQKLRNHSADLRSMGVARIAVFGSAARNEAVSGSDIDILVEFDRAIGLLHFVHVKRYLEALLNARVDLVTTDALHPAIRDRILQEAINAA